MVGEKQGRTGGGDRVVALTLARVENGRSSTQTLIFRPRSEGLHTSTSGTGAGHQFATKMRLQLFLKCFRDHLSPRQGKRGIKAKAVHVYVASSGSFVVRAVVTAGGVYTSCPAEDLAPEKVGGSLQVSNWRGQ